jgi:hypothetical protein
MNALFISAIYSCLHSFFEKLRGNNEADDESVIGEFNKTCTMSYKNRIIACLTCYVVGYIITFGSIFAITQLGRHPEKFAIMYSLGNIIALMSTCFLWGPMSQMKKMFEKVRVVATIVYLLCIVFTIFVAVYRPLVGPIVMLIVIQFIAGFWYNISYIPFARTWVKRCLASCME